MRIKCMLNVRVIHKIVREIFKKDKRKSCNSFGKSGTARLFLYNIFYHPVCARYLLLIHSFCVTMLFRIFRWIRVFYGFGSVYIEEQDPASNPNVLPTRSGFTIYSKIRQFFSILGLKKFKIITFS